MATGKQVNAGHTYALIEAGGCQYAVSPQVIIEVNRLELDVGAKFETDKVLLVHRAGDSPQVGMPYVSGARVRGIVLSHQRDEKVLVFKQKRRKNYKRTRGHRQELTRVRIEDIKG